MKESLVVSEWMKYAGRDLKLSRHIMEDYPEDAVFHSQQAAEKALKAVLIKKFGELIKTRELVFLARKIRAPEEIISDCLDLNEVFTSVRYPGAEEVMREYTPAQAIEAAERVVSWSKKQI